MPLPRITVTVPDREDDTWHDDWDDSWSVAPPELPRIS